MVDPLHRPQLLQSLCKVPHLKVDLLQRLINEKPDMKRMHDQRQTETKVLVQVSAQSISFAAFANTIVLIPD